MKVPVTLLLAGDESVVTPDDLADAAPAVRVETFETAHDPFVQLMPVAEHSERLAIGTSIAVAFARSPMTMAYTANDLQTHSRGRLLLGLGTQVRAHITRRFSMPWSHPPPTRR